MRRGTARSDRPGREVVLVDESFVDAYMPSGRAVGEMLRFGEDTVEIVGVVGQVRAVGVDHDPRPTIYFHYLQASDNMMSYVLRSHLETEALTRAAKDAVWAVDPEQPVFNIRRMQDVAAQGTSSRRVTLLLLALFGGVAVLMAALGVYGVMSYAVGQRTHELALRQALGADAGHLVRMVLGEGLGLALAGIAAGLAVGLLVTRALATLLYGVTPTQPAAYGAVSVLLLAVAAVATLLPARRAARSLPMDALRGD